jgi:S1-C subfamily serine protease
MRTLRLSLLLLATLTLEAQTRNQLSPDIIYSRSKASVVTIVTFDAKRTPLAQGSGFVVAKNRVLTNYHVLAGSSSASVLYDEVCARMG